MPKVRKTATAKVITAAKGKPLFSITCKDLSLTLIKEKIMLIRIFQLANI